MLFICPVEKAIALGGVETGNNIPKEHASAVKIAVGTLIGSLIENASGRNKLAAAVLLIKNEKVKAKMGKNQI